jgi:tetratricopeptide (TPR) repeat protein
MSHPLRIRAALIPALLVLLAIFIAPVRFNQLHPATPEDLLHADLAANHPTQALYQVLTLAAQTGWTEDLARTAAHLWETLGDVSRAAAYWELAVKNDPTDLGVAKQLARTDLDLQDWSAAVIALNHVIKLSPDDTWAHYQLGLLQAAFDPQQALVHLRTASREPTYRDTATALLFLGGAKANDPTTVMRVGLVFASLHLWGYAEMVFQYAVDLAAPFPEALAYTGLARDNQGKDGGSQIEQAVTLAPLNAQVRYLEGLHLRLGGDNSASLNALLQAMNLDPLNPAYAAELGSAYQLVDQLGQAEYWLKQAVALSRNDSRFQDLLAQFYQRFPALGQ